MVTRIHEPLRRDDVARAVEGRCPPRIPLVMARWWGEGLHSQYGDRLKQLDERFPDDVTHLWMWPGPINTDLMNLPWKRVESGGLDNRPIIDDWAKLDDFIGRLPCPETDPTIAGLPDIARHLRAEDRYVMFSWWNLYYEKPWGLRGMQNLLLDYYDHPEEIHRLHSALRDTYLAYLRWGIRELDFDGFFTSDDLGHQTQLMMSPPLFDEFIQPYYQPLGDLLKAHGKHFWLHSCGNNTDALEGLVKAGLTVFHPVQKHTMDEVETARKYRGRLSFLVGFDVQQILRTGTPDEVRREVRHLIDTFDAPGGGMCMAAGNGIVAGTPFENIEAFLEESALYGRAHRESFA
jgi:uroporphyrinogen decarboxylase